MPKMIFLEIHLIAGVLGSYFTLKARKFNCKVMQKDCINITALIQKKL